MPAVHAPAACSMWSKINTQRVERLVAAGRMQPAGLAEVDRAKRDGRWAATTRRARRHSRRLPRRAGQAQEGTGVLPDAQQAEHLCGLVPPPERQDAGDAGQAHQGDDRDVRARREASRRAARLPRRRLEQRLVRLLGQLVERLRDLRDRRPDLAPRSAPARRGRSRRAALRCRRAAVAARRDRCRGRAGAGAHA